MLCIIIIINLCFTSKDFKNSRPYTQLSQQCQHMINIFLNRCIVVLEKLSIRRLSECRFLRLLNVTVVFQKDSNNFSRLIGDVVHLYVPATKMHH